MRVHHLLGIAIAVVAVAASVADAQGNKKQPTGSLMVIDGNGTVVGPLVGSNSVGIRVDGEWVQGIVLRHVILPQNTGPLLFESANCSTDALLQVSNVPEFLSGYVADAQAGTYHYFYPADIRSRTALASAQLNPDGSHSACNPMPVPLPVAAGVMTEVALSYVPPFSVK